MSSRRRYALFAAIPFVGHLNPLLRQASELARRGWRVAVATHEEGRAHVENKAPDVAFVSVGSYGAVAATVAEMEAAATRDPDFGRGAFTILQCLSGLWPTMFDGLSAAVRADRPDILIGDLFSAATLDVAESQSIPLVINDADLLGSVYTGLHAPDHIPPMLTGTSRNEMGKRRRILSRLRRPLGVRAFERAVGGPLNAHRRSRGLPPVHLAARFKDRLVLVNGAFGLEYPRPIPPLLQMVGPMLPDSIEPIPPDYNDWLDREEPVVYVNLGTVAAASKTLLGILSEGLAAYDFRVLWVLRKAQHASLPNSLAPNIRVESWVPSPVAILASPKVRAFVSHCGMNSVHESLFAGTPIVGIPLFGDQLDMAVRVQDAGVGLWLNKNELTPARLREAIRKVLSTPEFSANIPAIQSSFALAGGVRRAADLIEHAAEVGTAHYQERRPNWT